MHIRGLLCIYRAMALSVFILPLWSLDRFEMGSKLQSMGWKASDINSRSNLTRTGGLPQYPGKRKVMIHCTMKFNVWCNREWETIFFVVWRKNCAIPHNYPYNRHFVPHNLNFFSTPCQKPCRNALLSPIELSLVGIKIHMSMNSPSLN